MYNQPMKIVFAGSVDHGKSTLIGRILLETRSLSQDKIRELKRIAQELGGEAELAYLVDQLKEERQQHKTIDTAQIFFTVKKRPYIIIDTPGHIELIQNMLTGASAADAAVLIVDIQEGTQEQSKRHAYLLKMLGITKVIIAVNKIDLTGSTTQQQYEKIAVEFREFFAPVSQAPIPVIPISAAKGYNVVHRSKTTAWYKGPALLEAIDRFRVAKKHAHLPMRFCVQDIYETDAGKSIVGKVLSGVIRKGEEVVIVTSQQKARIKSLQYFLRNKTKAVAQESIGLLLEGSLSLKRGDVISETKVLPRVTTTISADIFWTSLKPLLPNDRLTLRCATQETSVCVQKIDRRINTATLLSIEESSPRLLVNEAGRVTLCSDYPIAVEPFSFIPALGRIVVERENILEGVGVVV
ncbi:MAG: GTP-binding protein [Candidatus Omnitrophica bacterium]|nr:GTP-binding protein [Candidatus Omnitrophota bacterium]